MNDIKLTYEPSPNLLRFFIKEKKLLQLDLAKHFNVSAAAITKAIDDEPGLESLRKKIIEHLMNIKIN